MNIEIASISWLLLVIVTNIEVKMLLNFFYILDKCLRLVLLIYIKFLFLLITIFVSGRTHLISEVTPDSVFRSDL